MATHVDYAVTVKIGLLLVLLIFSGFLSGSESSFFSLTPLHIHKMKEDHMPFVGFVQRLLARPRRLLATIVVANESVNIAITALTTSLFLYLLGPHGTWVAIAVTLAVLMLLGEALPKTFAVTYPRRFSVTAALLMTAISKIVYPAAWLLEKISDFFLWCAGGKDHLGKRTVMEDDFKTLVDVGHQEGALEETQKDLIHSVFDLADTKVADIMTPRVDMFCLPLSINPNEIKQEVIAHRLSRIPVYGADKDDILGIINAKDLLTGIEEGTTPAIRSLLKKPYFVPEERQAHSMLSDFKIRNIQMAIVVDEYGGVSGLVTLTDILSCLFGNLYQELNSPERMLSRLDDTTYAISGTLQIEDFNDHLKASIPTDDFDTIGGFVLHLFGQLPTPGESVSYGNFLFTADKITRTRISALRVQKNTEKEDHGG